MSNLKLPCSVQQKFAITAKALPLRHRALNDSLAKSKFLKKERKCQNDKDDIFIESYTILRLVMLASS